MRVVAAHAYNVLAFDGDDDAAGRGADSAVRGFVATFAAFGHRPGFAVQ
jgi:hypothetical protein